MRKVKEKTPSGDGCRESPHQAYPNAQSLLVAPAGVERVCPRVSAHEHRGATMQESTPLPRPLLSAQGLIERAKHD